MSFNKFYLIHRYIHFETNNKNYNDPLYKIRNISNKLKEKWSKYYNPGKELTIDECMIKFQGKCSFLQYIQNKPVPWGVKCFMLCDARSYYCLDLKIYCGISFEEKYENFSATDSLIINLMSKYFNQGKILYCDNYFTSMKIYNYLFSMNTGIVGTWKNNRIPGYKQLKLPDKSFFVTYVHKRYRSLLLTIWNDKKMVNMMNSAYYVYPIIKENKYNKKLKVIPSIINEYNRFSHGVDFNNKNSYNFRFPHKSNKWTRNVFFHLVHICIQNCYIIFSKKHKMSYNKFYESIISSLLRKKATFNRKKLSHNIEYIDELKKSQRRCKECSKKSVWCCRGCDPSGIILCIPYCYNNYHKKVK